MFVLALYKDPELVESISRKGTVILTPTEAREQAATLQALRDRVHDLEEEVGALQDRLLEAERSKSALRDRVYDLEDANNGLNSRVQTSDREHASLLKRELQLQEEIAILTQRLDQARLEKEQDNASIDTLRASQALLQQENDTYRSLDANGKGTVEELQESSRKSKVAPTGRYDKGFWDAIFNLQALKTGGFLPVMGDAYFYDSAASTAKVPGSVGCFIHKRSTAVVVLGSGSSAAKMIELRSAFLKERGLPEGWSVLGSMDDPKVELASPAGTLTLEVTESSVGSDQSAWQYFHKVLKHTRPPPWVFVLRI